MDEISDSSADYQHVEGLTFTISRIITPMFCAAGICGNILNILGKCSALAWLHIFLNGPQTKLSKLSLLKGIFVKKKVTWVKK